MKLYTIKQLGTDISPEYVIIHTKKGLFGKSKRYWGEWQTIMPERPGLYTVYGWTRYKHRAKRYTQYAACLTQLLSLRDIVL